MARAGDGQAATRAVKEVEIKCSLRLIIRACLKLNHIGRDKIGR